MHKQALQLELLNSRMRNMELESVSRMPNLEALLEDQSHKGYLADIWFIFLSSFIGGAITK